MLHRMHLQAEHYVKILRGEKTIELRLYDEKRQKIKCGDEIELINASDREQKLMVQVVALHRFNSFWELFSALSVHACGFNSIDDYKVMEAYYSEKEQFLWGVVGIEFKTI